MSEDRGEHQPWPAGFVLLVVVGAVSGWLFGTLAGAQAGGAWALTDDALGLSGGAAAAAAGLAFAWTLERQRWAWTLMFAIGAALVAVTIVYWNGSPIGNGEDVKWRYVALVVALAAVVPLFQAMRDEGRWRFPYVAVHWYAWTDLAAAVAVGLLLLAGLALGLHASTAWTAGWAWAALGAALALAVGLARAVASSLDLQLPLRRLLSFFAPLTVVAVLALPLVARWTGSLAAACLLLALAAILFLNAVLGNGPDQQSPNRILRMSAAALALLLLALGILAGGALWIRMAEYGYSPSRLWAGVFALAVTAIAIRYAASLARRRRLWAEPVRRNNIRILGTLFVFGLILATPLASFSSFATRDQIARLQEGRIRPAEFDWQAVRFDFGRPGERAVEQLREGVETSPEVRSLAARALLARQRSEAPAPEPRRRP